MRGIKANTKGAEGVLNELSNHIKSAKIEAKCTASLAENIARGMEEYAISKKTIARKMDFLNVFNTSERDEGKVSEMVQAVEQLGLFDIDMRCCLATVLITLLDQQCVARCGANFDAVPLRSVAWLHSQ